jgi:hypothetical protein
VVARVRRELGDLGTPFQDSFGGTGELGQFDLSESGIATATVTTVASGVVTQLVPDRDYTIEPVEGRILLLGSANPLPDNTTLIVSGLAQGMFTDEELDGYVREAVRMHCGGRHLPARVLDQHGFIQYPQVPEVLANLPEIEFLPLTLLATVNALWSLATDASTDIDISTVEGTTVARSQRFQQLMTMIDAINSRYRDYCQQLNIGFWRIEQTTLRRVSRTTGRLVPIYKEREYDDYSLPIRLIPEIDYQDEDTSQVPDPGYGGGYW